MPKQTFFKVIEIDSNVEKKKVNKTGFTAGNFLNKSGCSSA